MRYPREDFVLESSCEACEIKKRGAVIRFFYAWGTLPWRKPLISLSCVHFLITQTICTVLKVDIPPNITEIYKMYMLTILTAGFGGSYFESWDKNRMKERCGLDEENSQSYGDN